MEKLVRDLRGSYGLKSREESKRMQIYSIALHIYLHYDALALIPLVLKSPLLAREHDTV
jgi:hypothetical protein